MSEEERFSSQDLLDTSASDIWINIKLAFRYEIEKRINNYKNLNFRAAE